jgi:hypothetical protein
MYTKAQQSLIRMAQSLLETANEMSADSEPAAAAPAPVSAKRGPKPGLAKTGVVRASTVGKTAKATKVALVATPAKEAAPAPKKKLGRPPKAKTVTKAAPAKAKAVKAKAAPAKAAAKAKATPAKAKATPAKAKAAKAKATASAGAEGKLPTLKDRLKIVFGSDDVGIEEAINRLTARGKKWVPDAKDLRAYISVALSTHKDDFVRVSRGVYRAVYKGKAKKTVEVAAEKAEPAPAEKIEAPVTATIKVERAEKPEKVEKKAAKRHVNGSGSDEHSDLGNVLDNPFAP